MSTIIEELPKPRKFTRMEDPDGPGLWEVRDSEIHGSGVFAAGAIWNGERVIEYCGEKITKEESERRGDLHWARSLETGGGAVYLFTLNKKYDVDGAFPWNPARLINHSCDPNCEVHIVKGRIWVVALMDIEDGTELSFNYGFDAEDYESHPCRCGKARCVGYIVGEDYWPDMYKQIAKKEKAAKQKARK